MMVLSGVLYYMFEIFPDSYITSEESFKRDYNSDMTKILHLLKEAGDSSLFVKLNSNSVKIENKNGWFSKHLQNFLEDYVYECEDYSKVLKKEKGRPPIDTKRKYFQYCFSKILNEQRQSITNDFLRFLKKFMEILGFTYDVNFRSELDFLKVMRTELREIENNGSSFQPVYYPKNYDEIDYQRRIAALENGTTYTSIDDLTSYKADSDFLHKSGLYHLENENAEESLNSALKELYQKGWSCFDPESTPLKISR